jgi:flagellar hook protein FlgE
MGFGQGLSGLNAAAQSLDVIGNNVANASTVGFKAAKASFADVYASSRVGLGVKVSGIDQRFSAGTVSTSNSAYHMAIDGGVGFFRLVDGGGQVAFTRNGEFKVDKNNFVVNNQGYKLTGYPAGAGAVGLNPVPIQIPQGNIAPLATTSVVTQANLSANAPIVPNITPFDRTIAATYSGLAPTTVFDSLGNSHVLTQYFTKRTPIVGNTSRYEVNLVVDTNPPQGFQTFLTFDRAGRLISVPTYNLVVANPGGAGTPALNMPIAVNYAGTSQYGGDFKQVTTANGYPTGVFTGVAIGEDGSIMGNYSNGRPQVIGTIALANFANVQGLKPIGNNAWIESPDSGPATLGQPGTNSLSILKGQALEASNVDMSMELVDMIVNQRNYQANAQTIKTQDQVLQTLLQIR